MNWKHILAEHGTDECRDVSASLPEYLILGDEAHSEMPEIHIHLQSCRRCYADLTMLKEAGEHSAWENFAREITKPPPPSSLILVKNVWKWLTNNLQIEAELSENDINRNVGDWLFQSFGEVATTGVHFPDDVKPPLSLSTELPNNLAKIHLKVIPEYRASEHKEIWNLHLELDETSQLSRILAGAEHKNDMIAKKSLRKDRPVEFQLTPPMHNNYSLIFEWKSSDGKWQKHRTEIPLQGNKGAYK